MPDKDGIAVQAIRWSALLHAGRLTAAEQAALEAWRNADPAHECALQAQLTEQRAAASLTPELVQRLYGGELPKRPNLARRRALRVGAFVLGSGAVGALTLAQRDTPEYHVQRETRKGERQQLALPDGSHLTLNTDTHLEVAFYASRRHAALLRGEALFALSREAVRPFEVACASLVILGDDTRLNVRRDLDGVQVSVQSGAVRVRSGPWWRRSDTHLQASQGLYVTEDGATSAVRTANLATDLAWLDGRLVFRNTPLTQVVLELNRYLSTSLRLADESVGRLRLSGSFSIDDPQGLLSALSAALPIVFTPLPDGTTLVSRTPPSA